MHLSLFKGSQIFFRSSYRYFPKPETGFSQKNCLIVRQFSDILFALILPHMLNRPPVVVFSAEVVVSL